MSTRARHGLRSHPLYQTWKDMMSRCYNPNCGNYVHYGMRGIKVCDRWFDICLFVKDVVNKPDVRCEFDRRDNNGHYSPRNTRWVSRRTNSQNTRIAKRWIIDGVTYLSQRDAAEKIGIGVTTVKNWCDGDNQFSRGKWYFTPPRKGCYSYKLY